MKVRPISLICLIGVTSCYADFVDTRTIEYGLQENTEVLVNSRGLAQSDLSIQAGSYTGSGISINGLNLKSPWSAHFNSELPIPSYLLSNATATHNMANISGHLVGTAAYTTMPQSNRVQGSAAIGTEEHYQATLISSAENVGGFLDGEKARHIDYDENNLDRAMGGAYAQTVVNDWQLDLIGGYQKKEFGNEGYYLAEQELQDSLLFLGASKGDLSDSFIRASTALRQMDFDTADSHYGALMLEGRTMEIQHIALNLRGDLENEYADGSDRTRGSVLILPEARFERLTVKAGLNSVFQTSESAEFLPTAGVDWFATDNGTVFAAYSETVQQPDFETLQNNALLKMQKSRNAELGFRQFLSASLDWRVAGFYRRLENASDWTAGGNAVDMGDLNISGMDGAVNWYPSEELELRAFYQWVYKDSKTVDGLYESDYPEHLLTFSGHWKFLPEFLLFAVQDLRYQTENTVRTSSDFGALASLGLHYEPRYAKNVRLSFLVENLWGSNFQSIPGVEARPTTASAGITIAW